MDNQMKNIINQLSSIEDTAVRIMQLADRNKKELSLEMEQRTKKFDEQLAADIKERLQKMQDKLNAEKNAELEKLKTANLDAQSALNENFQKNHTKWAKEILDELIGA